MKNSAIIVLLAVFSTATFAQSNKSKLDLATLPVPKWHYQVEYTFDKITDQAGWDRQGHGLHAAFVTTDERYMRCEVPEPGVSPLKWEQAGWRGERLNAQLVIWSPDTLPQIRLKVSNLTDPKGNIISSNNLQLNMVRYVVSNFSYGAVNFGCDAYPDSVWLMPDRLESFERFDLPGNTVRPVWITCNIPRGTEPGDYTGIIHVVSESETISLSMKITVQHPVLPEPSDWKFRLDLWQNPWVIAWYFHVEPWSDEHLVLLKKHLKLYADAGGKYITTYAVHSPWSDNSYMIEGTMIEWIKTSQGTWKFDYSIFDRYVELAMETGIDKAITVYTPLPWANRFRYMDENSGNYVYEVWTPDSEKYKVFWNRFLDDLKQHLVQKGWFGKTYLGINENEMEYTLAAARLIRAHSKDWKITYAGNWHAELSPLLDDYSPVISSEASPAEMKERARQGFTTTYYVCCTPPKPNNFVFSLPAESRYIGWYAMAYGYDGFLRWAYDAWPADPVRDARHTLWPAGDCFLVYPGGNSSIRYEKLREGIVDYEKIIILRDFASKSSNPQVNLKLKELDALLETLTTERDYNKRDFSAKTVTEVLKKGNLLIGEITDLVKH